MQTYGKYSPTGFDPEGAFLHDQHDWLVVPVGQTRDSGPLDQSNFATAQKILEDACGEEEEPTWEVHRFGHWGPGWFEIILVKPGGKAQEAAEDIERALADYPVLDDTDHSQREWDDFCECWQSFGCKEFIELLSKEFSLTDATEERLLDADREVIREWYMQHANEPYFQESSGVCIPLDSLVKKMQRPDMFALIAHVRKSELEAAKETA